MPSGWGRQRNTCQAINPEGQHRLRSRTSTDSSMVQDPHASAIVIEHRSFKAWKGSRVVDVSHRDEKTTPRQTLNKKLGSVCDDISGG